MSYKWIIDEKVNTRKGNLVVEDNILYVTIMLITKGKDPTWHIDTLSYKP